MDVSIVGRPDISLLPVAWLILAAGLAVLWFRSRSLPRLLFAAVFGVYLVFAIAAVYFPLRIDPGIPGSLRAVLRTLANARCMFEQMFEHLFAIPHQPVLRCKRGKEDAYRKLKYQPAIAG